MERIGAALSLLLDRRGITAPALAERWGVEPDELARYLSDAPPPPPTLVRRLLAALGADRGELERALAAVGEGDEGGVEPLGRGANGPPEDGPPSPDGAGQDGAREDGAREDGAAEHADSDDDAPGDEGDVAGIDFDALLGRLDGLAARAIAEVRRRRGESAPPSGGPEPAGGAGPGEGEGEGG